jgi:hypothetical protein
MGPPVRPRQFRRPWAPDGPDRHGQGPRPAIPPAMPARRAPAGFRRDRRRREPPRLARAFGPHAAAGRQRRTGAGDRAARPRPGRQPCHPGPPAVPQHPRQARRQRGQTAFPGAARGQTARCAPEGPQPRRDGSVLVEKGQQGLGGRQPTHHHAAQRLPDPALRGSFGAAPPASGRCRRPGSPVNEHNQADKETRGAEPRRTSGVAKCGNGDPTGSAGLWPGLARLLVLMTTPQLTIVGHRSGLIVKTREEGRVAAL